MLLGEPGSERGEPGMLRDSFGRFTVRVLFRFTERINVCFVECSFHTFRGWWWISRETSRFSQRNFSIYLSSIYLSVST